MESVVGISLPNRPRIASLNSTVSSSHQTTFSTAKSYRLGNIYGRGILPSPWGRHRPNMDVASCLPHCAQWGRWEAKYFVRCQKKTQNPSQAIGESVASSRSHALKGTPLQVAWPQSRYK